MKINDINLEKVSLENKRQFCKEFVMSYLTEKEWEEAKSGFLPYLEKVNNYRINFLLTNKNVYGILVCMNPNMDTDYLNKYQFMVNRFDWDGFEHADYLAKKYLNYER